MSRKYEVVYILDSAMDETQINALLDEMHALLKTDGSQDPITDINHWGKRTLAYPIRGREVGYYVIAHFEAAPDALPEYERALKLNESVIRYLLVLNEGAKPVPVPTASDSEEKGKSEATE